MRDATIDIKKELIEGEDNMIAKFKVNEAAEIMRLSGSKHIGTVVLHIYENQFTPNNPVSFIDYTVSWDVPENIASEAFKSIQTSLMKRYGRK